MIDRPVREYYNPYHWKYSKTHLLMTLEFDTMHIWARPPGGTGFKLDRHECSNVHAVAESFDYRIIRVCAYPVGSTEITVFL